ncbi:MAG: archaeosortase C [ANME-2 cluster archaeon]|nr:archaeosortase C [ANME-2 cluster archaeon]
MKKQNIFLFLLILALFLGGTVEISEGSTVLGILLLFLALLTTSKINFGNPDEEDKSNYTMIMLLGLGIVLSDILFNTASHSRLGTLDIMTFLFGLSLITFGINNNELRRMGTFTAFMSATFLILFLVFFSLFNRLNIDFTHFFDHYFVLLPVVSILNTMQVPIEIIGTETVRMTGVEEMSVIIGGPCSGLYSMFMLIGIIVGYTRLEKFDNKQVYAMLLITAAVAYTSNIFRIISLYLVGYSYGSQTMMFVHTHLGWIIFTVVAGILLYILNKIPRHKVIQNP